ncbi:MAG: hypothetical protein ACYDGR_02745 [Candidatus Dormibacteria bacterium]
MGRLKAAAIAVLCSSVVGLSGMALQGTTPVRAQSAIAFEVPSVVDPIHTNGEPDVGVNPKDGTVYVSGPTGTGTQRSTWFGSVDGGHSFRIISPSGPAPQTVTPPTGFLAYPGGGDTEIAFDRAGKQYFNDLAGLVTLRSATTPDDGKTVYQGDVATGTAGPGADRQWYVVYDPAPGTPNQSAYTGPKPMIYLEYNNLQVNTTGASQWNLSNAAVDPQPGAPGINFVNAISGGAGNVTGYAPFGADGHPEIDQVTGKVFQTAGEQLANKTWSLLLNIGTPAADGTLTFLDQGNAGDPTKLIHVVDGLPSSPDGLFTVASMDQARNLHVVYTLDDPGNAPGTRQTFVTAASAASGWKTWTTPTMVSKHPEIGSNVSIFPWIKAGGPGRADAVWYAQNQTSDPSTPSAQVWNTYMAQAVYPVDGSGVITGAAPSITTLKVSPHPIHYGDVCLLGTGCITVQGNRNFADFFEVTIDKTGAAEVVYDDTSNGLAQAGLTTTGQQADHAGAGVITLARQNAGPGLFGTDVNGPASTPVNRLADATGDALFPVIGGTNIPGMDIVDTSLDIGGGNLKVTTRVVDLSNPSATGAALAAAGNANENGFLQFITRWQMGNTLYYAMTEIPTAAQDPSSATQFYAGATASIDLCSVSACFPHVLTYPETNSTETGSVSCPAAPSAANPCTITEKVALADIGNATVRSLLEELGTYALTSSQPQSAETNAQAQADQVPLQVDGACCIDFQAVVPAGVATPTPTSSSAPAPTPSPSQPPLPNTSPAKPGPPLPLLLLPGLAVFALARNQRQGIMRGRASRRAANQVPHRPG